MKLKELLKFILEVLKKYFIGDGTVVLDGEIDEEVDIKPIEPVVEPIEEVEEDVSKVIPVKEKVVIEPEKHGKQALTFVDCDKVKVKTLISEYKHFKTTYKGITIHNNGNTKSTAANDVAYALNKRYVNDGYDASWHYSVDDTQVVRFVPWGYSCWCSGDGSKGYGNSKTINIEINEFNGYKNPSDPRWIKARENAIHLIAQLCVDMNWSIDAVGTHNDRSGKNCPRVILKEGLNEFKIEIAKEINNIKEDN